VPLAQEREGRRRPERARLCGGRIGVSAELLDRWLTDRPFDVVVCPALIDELRDVLARDRFRRWISIHESELFGGRLETEGERWADPTDIPAVTGDPKDDYLVALYRDCDADLLVSGDPDLLDLEADHVSVVTPGELLAQL
jgi:uncharacterized protein